MGSHSVSTVPFYADILVVVPSVISFVVVVVLLTLVYIIFTRKPRHPNDIYGHYNGDQKLQSEGNESVIMGELDVNHNGKKGVNLEGGYHHQGQMCPMQSNTSNINFQTPYAMTNFKQGGDDRRQMSAHMTLRGSPHKSVILLQF